MYNEYFEQLIKEAKNGKKITVEESQFIGAYFMAIKNGEDYLSWNTPFLKGRAVEIVKLMKKADIKKIYVSLQWSNQLDELYELQCAGLEIAGIEKLPNIGYKRDIERRGHSVKNPVVYAMVLAINE